MSTGRRRRRSARVCVVACACAVALASCGADALEPVAARELGDAYELVAAAVDAGDRADARRVLQDLIGSVEELRAAGEIDAERADEILAAAAEVTRALRSLPAPSSTASPGPSPSTSSPAPPTTEEGPDGPSGSGGDGGNEGHDHGGGAPGNSGGQGNGNAHGHDKD